MGLMARQVNKSINSIPTTFLGLQKKLFLLRPIHSRADYNRSLRIASDLAARTDLNREQADYLGVLTRNIKEYEDERFVAEKHSPLEILKFLVSENKMSGSELGRILGSRTLGPAILRGERGLSKTHIGKLAQHFLVNPALFLAL